MQKVSRSCAEAGRRAHVEEQARSGLTVAAYCAGRGLSSPTFYEWRRRLADEKGRPAFVQVQVTPPRRPEGAGGPSGVEVVLTGGARLRLERGFDAAALRSAVAAIEGRPC